MFSRCWLRFSVVKVFCKDNHFVWFFALSHFFVTDHHQESGRRDQEGQDHREGRDHAGQPQVVRHRQLLHEPGVSQGRGSRGLW